MTPKREKLRGEFVGLSMNGAVFQEIRHENRKGIRRASGQIETFLETDSGPLFIVTNFPPQDIPRSGESEFRGMQVGKITRNGRPIPIYDYGLDHVVPIITTNKPAQTREEQKATVSKQLSLPAQPRSRVTVPAGTM